MNTEANRLAADIGGTFTDVAVFQPATQRMLLGKALSTPRRMVDGIAHAVDKTESAFSDADIFLHGSTVAINTMLERKGARTALLITEGFRDAYEIGRINRPDAYNLFFQKHVPLVRRSLRFEVRERLKADGSVHVPLDEAGVVEICGRLKALEIEAVAIVLLHCYANPSHEIAVKRIVSQHLPSAFVTASHELSQEYREYERCSTTAANAFIGPIVRDYIGGIETHLQKSGFKGSFLVVQSTGGLYQSDQAKTQCVRMLESGPAAGVVGAQALCRVLGIEDAIAFDMGGTTAKAGVISNGQILTATTALVGGYAEGLPIQIPLVDVFEVGTGGGSIAVLDPGRALRVGPRSAGADPGPACYGLGGKAPTVTDANVVLGRLGVNEFLGGEMRLDREAAASAIRNEIATPLGLSVERAAEGILDIAVTKMSYAVKGVSTERGLDAAAFALIAYGGAGPLHACAVAREIGIKRVLIPHAPGHFCAFGMLHSDLRYDNVRTWLRNLDDLSFGEMDAILTELTERGRAALKESGIEPVSITVKFAADMRYVGQEHAVTVDFGPDLLHQQDRVAVKQAFDDVHAQRYGTSAPEESAQIVSLRASVAGLLDKPSMHAPQSLTASGAARGNRDIYFGKRHGLLPTPAYRREDLAPGRRVAGPAVIEEYASTTVLFPSDRLVVDRLGNLDIEVGGNT